MRCLADCSAPTKLRASEPSTEACAVAAGPRIAATWGGRWARRRSAGQHGFRPGPVARGASCSPHRWAGSQQRPAPLAAAPRSATDLSDLVEPRCRPDISTAMYYLVLLVRGGGSFCTIGHACPVALKSLCRVAPCRQAHHVWQAHHVRQAHRVRQRPTARGTRAELSPGFAARLWLASWVQTRGAHHRCLPAACPGLRLHVRDRAHQRRGGGRGGAARRHRVTNLLCVLLFP